jgi:hypothetical protein
MTLEPWISTLMLKLSSLPLFPLMSSLSIHEATIERHLSIHFQFTNCETIFAGHAGQPFKF